MTFKRRVLSALGKDELLEIGRDLELEVTTRMAVDDLRDALAKSKRASLTAIVQESLSRDTLKDICGAVGLDDTGKEKAALVERILAAGGDKAANGAGYRLDPAAVRGSKAAEGDGALSALLSGLDAVPAKKPPKAKGKTKNGERRRGGVPESEAVIAGTLKAALQQFALGAAGGYSGGDAHVAFTTHLLECFGWPAGRPDGAAIPYTFAIADAGKRVAREVALWWPERRTLLEVAGHDAGLDSAWKDLVRLCLQLDPIPQYVVLTNQRDLQLYDLARDREAPRLAIRIDDLPLRRVRAELMEQNGWTLRALYQAAEVDGPHPLKDAQAALDAAVADAYGMPPDQGPTEFLLELNQLVAEDEQQGRKVRGPGLPDHLAPKDPRWFSTDCIEPPPVES
jgi:hypothetical protein